VRIRGVLYGAILLMAAAGCAGQPAGSSPAASTPAASSPAVSPPAWTAPAAYRFTFESSCGERPLIGRFRVDVANGVVDRTRGLDEPGKRAVMLRIANLVPTLEQMVADAEQARADGAHEVVIERDPADGHPVAIRIDPARDTYDDETCYTISDYTIGGTAGPEPSPNR
jgi:hypothetical protein